jgi:hypothetical protein
MTGTGDANAECRRLLEQALGDSTASDRRLATSLADVPPGALDEGLRAFAAEHGAAALPVLTTLAEATERNVRRSAKRALYRLAQRGVTPPPRPAPRPVVSRQTERITRAWLSGVDGTGSRAAWIVFEGPYGGTSLCSLILNDTVGILEVAGGTITRKRLETELAGLRANQKLPWVETEPARAASQVTHALALHRTLGTHPAPGFERWEPLFAGEPEAEEPPLPTDIDPALVERTPELLERPELASWFLDPDEIQPDAVELLQARESRLVVSDQVKAEREAAILARVIERELNVDARRRWARRLAEMVYIFRVTDRADLARLAETAASSLGKGETTHNAFARALARRGLELAGEVATGRLSSTEVSRKPQPTGVAGITRAEPGGHPATASPTR